MKTVVFILVSLSDSHYRNRIMEFANHNIPVEVYGFERKGNNKTIDIPYKLETLGLLEDESYKSRLKLYIKQLKKIGRKYKDSSAVFYLTSLDLAMVFHCINPKLEYIYEECDLTHTYLGKLKYFLEIVDKRIIKKSLLTISTSQGFINFHFKGICPNNVCLVENKLNPSIIEIDGVQKRDFDKKHLSIGFVGGPRFDSVYNFIDKFCSNFPQYVFHIYGGPVPENFNRLSKYKNCEFHGFFKNPVDLPQIYSSIDLVLATYDVKFENVRYAEPNKIYESIYFETPIIVSKNTFLSEKVERLGIGYSINAMDEHEVVDFINDLSLDSIKSRIYNIKKIDKSETLNYNVELFERIERLLV